MNLKLKTGNQAAAGHSSLATCHFSRGVALVVTLILLAVTLVMAVAFLAISRRERGSVSTETDTTTAKLAADSALASAEARMVSDILNTTNPYVSRLYVSTNYVNALGFTNNSTDLANVNYDTVASPGGALSAVQMQQNIANLFYSPRPPVFYSNATDFRYYLDLNRNGRYDTNGLVTNIDNSTPSVAITANLVQEVGDPEWIGVLEHPDSPHGPNNRFIARYCFVAIPANSLDLNHIHNQALDVGIANGTTAVNQNTPGTDSFSRDQGVGTWEMNLAAFLADLNTNRWDPTILNPNNSLAEPYLYPEGLAGRSVAFDDARALVAWRYNNHYEWLPSVNQMAANPGNYPSNVDIYSIGPQITYDSNYFGTVNSTRPWLGSPNTNNYFSLPADLFNTNKALLGILGYSQFANNLLAAGTLKSTYDRYTYYRMLSQLGSDSAPESGKVNVNYQNAIVNYDFNAADIANFGIGITNVATSITIVPNMETNFTHWQPHDFFTVAANQLLHSYSTAWYQSSPSNYFQTYYGLRTNYNSMSALGLTNFPFFGMTNQFGAIGITNIPVFVNGSFVYTPAVNRLLQLAANIYDSSRFTNNLQTGTSNYPSVFIPVLWKTNELNYLGVRQNDVYIRGYQYVQEPITSSSPAYFNTPIEVTDLPFGISTSNVWGVPWIIGAKKGFPNFNAFQVESRFFVERELQFNRNSSAVALAGGTFPYGRTYSTNQMYIMSITNYLGVEDWNSYASNYANQVTIVANDQTTVMMTNDGGGTQPVPPFNTYAVPTTLLGVTNVSVWSGYLQKVTGDPSFILPLQTNSTWLTNSVYYYGTTPQVLNGVSFPGPGFIPTAYDPSNYLDQGTPPLPTFALLLTNRLQAYILDTHDSTGSYILDYVQLGGMDSNLNINQAIADPDNQGMWSTNYFNYGGNTPFGVNEQFLVSSGTGIPGVDNDAGVAGWSKNATPGVGLVSAAAQIAYFQAFFAPSDTAPYGTSGTISNFDLSIQAPYTPFRLAVQRFVYQANDPLVHYLTSDLSDFADSTNSRTMDNPPLNKLGVVSDRYMPWASKGHVPAAYNLIPTDQNAFNLSYKDPLVLSADNWDFPTNKYPAIGWLGRVHRGTPWQSVYLKSSNLLTLATGNGPVGAATWQAWTGNQNPYDATNTAPMQDRLLFDLFSAAPNDDATRGRLSINIGADDPNNSMAGLASWSALLSGAVAFSNTIDDRVVKFFSAHQSPLFGQFSASNNFWILQPQGPPPYPKVNPMAQIVQSINTTRASRTNLANPDALTNVFEHVGDILSVPQLSDGSPFINVADSVQQQNGISDEMYEWLPQQIMGLLTVNGPAQSPQRYVVYCYGQTLKPAANGIVASGNFFNLVTNYQVTAEFGSRALIRIDNAPTPANPTATPHVVVEQYNPLPPD